MVLCVTKIAANCTSEYGQLAIVLIFEPTHHAYFYLLLAQSLYMLLAISVLLPRVLAEDTVAF
jgi:hypothetical protein